MDSNELTHDAALGHQPYTRVALAICAVVCMSPIKVSADELQYPVAGYRNALPDPVAIAAADSVWTDTIASIGVAVVRSSNAQFLARVREHPSVAAAGNDAIDVGANGSYKLWPGKHGPHAIAVGATEPCNAAGESYDLLVVYLNRGCQITDAMLYDLAVDIGPPGYDSFFGYGRGSAGEIP